MARFVKRQFSSSTLLQPDPTGTPGAFLDSGRLPASARSHVRNVLAYRSVASMCALARLGERRRGGWRGGVLGSWSGIANGVALAIEEAVRPVAAAQVGATREALAADRHSVRAARMEAAAGRRGNQTRDLAARGEWLGRCGTVGIGGR